MAQYIFTGRETSHRHDALSALLDPGTLTALQHVGVAPGWRCWEIGAGGGSVARMLAELVGPQGSVLATDLQPDLIDVGTAGNVEVLRHDVQHDPLPEGTFDLIHTRLVLIHLPEAREIIARLVAALRPGGWMLLEEFDTERIPQAIPDAADDRESRFNQIASIGFGLTARHGAELALGRHLPAILRGAGLTEVAADGTIGIAGQAPAHFWSRSLDRLRDLFTATGKVTHAEIDEYITALERGDLQVTSPLIVSARGRLPG